MQMTCPWGPFMKIDAWKILDLEEVSQKSLFSSSTRKCIHQVAWDAVLEEEVRWSTVMPKGILNTTLVEANYNISSCWYLVPTRLAKIYPDASPQCFQGCRQERSMFHIWWSCLKIQIFCIRILNHLYSVIGVNISRNARVALFTDLSDEVPRHLWTFVFLFYFVGC